MEKRYRLASSIAAARDEQLAQIVALVDAMPIRGPADALIAPHRERLQQLCPPRPVRLNRLLFRPLDPVIIPAADWRPGTAALPRTALTPLWTLVRDLSGRRLVDIEQEQPAADILERKGGAAMLWSEASQLLRTPQAMLPPIDWRESGLPADVFVPLCQAVAQVLGAAGQIEAWADLKAATPLTAASVLPVIAAAIAAGRVPGTMQIAVLLARFPEAATEILRATATAGREDPRLASVCAECAQDLMMDQLRSIALNEVARAPLTEATGEIQRAASLLEGLARQAGPQRRAALEDVRLQLDAQCRRRLAHAVAEDLLGPATMITDHTPSNSVAKLEAAARNIRQLGQIAGQLADGAALHYQQALRQGASRIRTLSANGPLTIIDRVRLVEILAGPEEALQVLQAPEAIAGAPISRAGTPTR